MGTADAWRIEHHQTIGSTNDEAQLRLGNPSSGGQVIVADEQTAGSGRRGRRWIAPPRSGLLFTAILPKAVPASSAWGVTFWTGLAVADALGRWNVRPTLQWPNDVLVEGRKLCGILCISRIVGDLATLACGVGINVHRPQNRPDLDAIAPPPIFLDDVAVLGEDARDELLAEILRAFQRRLPSLNDPDEIAREWERRAELPLSYHFTFEGAGRLEGVALRLAHGGGLVVREPGGERTVELADAVRVVR